VITTSIANMAPPAAKKTRPTAALPDCQSAESNAASGAPTSLPTEPLATAPPGLVSIATLLEMHGPSPDAYLTTWAAQMKAYVGPTLISFLNKHQAHLIRGAIPHQRIEGNLLGG